ncbi:MAG: septum site-determining protein MinC [Candidatus Poribacteria bacterium]
MSIKRKSNTVEIKGFGDEIFIIFNQDQEFSFSDVESELVEKLYKSKNFFVGKPIVLDIKDRVFNYEECLRLKEILVDKFNLTISYARTNSPETIKNVEEIGWSVETLIQKEDYDTRTTIVKRTIRTGQKLKYEGNLVLIGDVNPGGEIIADGDIIVFGKLRGIAHAGVNGDRSATITAIELNPLQLRIADMIRYAPDSGFKPADAPQFAMIKEGNIVIDFVDKSKRGDI